MSVLRRGPLRDRDGSHPAENLRRAPQWAGDVVLVGALLAAAVWLRPAFPPGSPASAGDWRDGSLTVAAVAWWGGSVALAAAVAVRRVRPLAAFVAGAAGAAAHLLLVAPPTPADLGVLVLLHAVAVHRRRVVSAGILAGLLALLVGWCGYFTLHSRPAPGVPALTVQFGRVSSGPDGPVSASPWAGVAMMASLLVAAWAVGTGTRHHRAYLAQVRAGAAAEAAAQAALAVAAERARISRDLHDVVAHGLSVMVIQAQGGAAALDHRPEDTRGALTTIVETGRGSLAEMRRALGALAETTGRSRQRGAPGEPADAAEARHPQPGLDRLAALLAQVRQAGNPVQLHVDGAAGPLPATVELSAYRIVQEALTNTMRHARPGAAAEVRLTYGAGELSVEVRDEGGPSGAAGGGNGLRGMRERVALLGGRFDAGPAQRGFVVRATLPVAADQPAGGRP